MSENKDYISKVHEEGAVHISEDVIASIAAAAVTEVEGVCGLSANMAELLNKKSLSKGIKLNLSDNDEICIDCNVIALYGHPVMELAKNIQGAVTDAVTAMTGLAVAAVNVNVCGVAISKNTKK